MSKILAVIGVALCASGCVSRQVTVIDSAHDIVRLGRGVRGPVYVQGEDGNWRQAGVMRLPEGWYAGPMMDE